MKRIPDLVSVIIPCHNHGKYLHEAIDSVLNQTYQKFEIIVVDDGSDDKATIEVLKKINIPEVSVYHKNNGGVSSARNFGISRSRGEFILTLDSDDKFDSSFIEKGVTILETYPQIGMVTSYVKRFDSRGVISKQQNNGGDIGDFLKKNKAVACLLFRFQCWADAGGYDVEILGFEDWEFTINVTKHGWHVYSIPEYLFYYRWKENSMYQRVIENKPEIIKYMVKKHREQFQENIEEIIFEKELQIKELNESIEMYKQSLAMKIGSLIVLPFRHLKR